METKALPMATAIHIIYSVFGQSCSEKHKVSTAPLINHCGCGAFRFEQVVFFFMRKYDLFRLWNDFRF